MYTGLNCTAFNILLKWLEPVLPAYGSSPEEMQAMQHGAHTYTPYHFTEAIDDTHVNA
jgi:hypothetical protein